MQSRREVQREQSRGSARRTVRNIIIAVLVILLVVWIFLAISLQPRNAAKKQAVNLAERYAHLKDPGKFYIYNRESTYYAITGKNQKNQSIIVIVPQHGGNLRVLKQSDGITANQAITMTKTNRHPQKILKVALGVFNNKNVWEVTYRNKKGNLCYDLINFKTGKYVQNINNL